MSLSLQEAKDMISKDNIDKLKTLVTPKPVINTSVKVNNDIIMGALCIAVETGVIKTNSLDDRIIKLLNSQTNTLSAQKLGLILSHMRLNQPKMCCVIALRDKGINCNEIIKQWVFTGPEVYFNKMFEYVVEHFEITPSMVRIKMTEMLKVTIVNNVAQLIAKYYNTNDEEERKKTTISISTITRLVNMCGHQLTAEFVEM